MLNNFLYIKAILNIFFTRKNSIGSVFLLLKVLGIRLYGSNEPILNFETSANQLHPMALEIIFYIGVFITFDIKLPIIPLHTWLRDANGEAHYSTCTLLASF